MSSRVLPNWLSAYAEYTKELEAPESYHLWTGLSVLASAIRRNLWLDQGNYPVYPNMFVVLVGPAGKMGKSTTIRMGRRLLLGVEGIKIGPDSITKEELIKQLAKSYAGGQCALTLHSTELSSLIDPSGIFMIQFLTDIYDCDYDNSKGWRYGTKHQGKDVIRNPVLNILAGTTPSWIADGMPTKVVEHGFTSRTVFVFEDSPRFLNPRPRASEHQLVEALIQDLQDISEQSGQFTWGEGAEELYDEEYKRLYEDLPTDHRVESFHWRKRTHILKVAMLLSISESNSLIVSARDIEAASSLIKLAERNMPKTFSAVGKYEHASDIERILAQIRRAGGMSVSDIYQSNYFVGDNRRLSDIMQTLVRMRAIVREERDGEGFYLPSNSKH